MPGAIPGSAPTDPLVTTFESNLSPETISSLLSDRSVVGTSVVTGTSFVMNLDANGKATVALKIRNTSAIMQDEGTWWVEKGKYCYKFSRFGKGLRRCRHVFEERGNIKFMFLSGLVVDWRIAPRTLSERSADGTVDEAVDEIPRRSR